MDSFLFQYFLSECKVEAALMNKTKLGGHKHDATWWLVPMEEEPGIENEF